MTMTLHIKNTEYSTAAADAMQSARAQLVMISPWFASLALRLRVTQTRELPTMATDGTHLFYHPEFTLKLSKEERIAIVCHEVLHCALKHPYRKGNADQKRANIAMDHVVNLQLRDARTRRGEAIFTLPDIGLFCDQKYEGMTWEQVYNLLQAQQDQQNRQGQGQGQGQGNVREDVLSPSEGKQVAKQSSGGGNGDKVDSTEENGSSGRMLDAADWDVAIEQASRLAPGTAPAQFKRLLEASKPRIDWRETLRNVISAGFPSEQTWTRPNRRVTHCPTPLPGWMKESSGFLVFAVDTSGSISQKMLADVWAEIRECCEATRPERIVVLSCDTQVHDTLEFGADAMPETLELHGGGGTRFNPVFQAVEAMDEEPSTLVFLTDLRCSDAPVEPSYQVLWVTPAWQNQQGPFGETAQMV